MITGPKAWIRDRWYVSFVPTANPAAAQVVWKMDSAGVTREQAATQGAERHAPLSAPVSGRYQTRPVREYHPVATVFHPQFPAEIEGGEVAHAPDRFDYDDTDLGTEPDPIWVHVGEHSITVPPEQVDAVLVALRDEATRLINERAKARANQEV